MQEKWEKMNNVAERFNEQANKEKMWQNFNASCRNLRLILWSRDFHYVKSFFSDFQLIVEQLKNEIRKGLQQGLAAYAAEYVGTKASSLFDTKKIQNKIKIDLLKGNVFEFENSRISRFTNCAKKRKKLQNMDLYHFQTKTKQKLLNW